MFNIRWSLQVYDLQAYDSCVKIGVKSGSFAEYHVDSNAKDAKLVIGCRVKISKYKNIFSKGHAPNYSKKVFAISKIKNTVSLAYVINVLNG